MKLLLENWRMFSEQVNEEEKINRVFNEQLQVYLENNPHLMSESIMDIANYMPLTLKKIIIGAGLLTSFAGSASAAEPPPPPQEVAAQIVNKAQQLDLADQLGRDIDDAADRIDRGLAALFGITRATGSRASKIKQTAEKTTDIIKQKLETEASPEAGEMDPQTKIANVVADREAQQAKADAMEAAARKEMRRRFGDNFSFAFSLQASKFKDTVKAKTKYGSATLKYSDVTADAGFDAEPGSMAFQVSVLNLAPQLGPAAR